MKEQILKLIFDYSNKYRMIDRKYIDSVIDIVVNSMNLNNYVGKIDFKNGNEPKKIENKKKTISIRLANEENLADLTYNFLNHNITIYMDKIPKIYEELNKIEIDTNEKQYFKTFFYTQRILHELFHANQAKFIKEKDNMESKIIDKFIPKVNITKNQSIDEKTEEITRQIFRMALYMKNYKYDAHERMAEIDSHKLLLSIISLSFIKLPNTKQFFSDNLLKGLIVAYEDTFSPTIKFISEMDELYNINTLKEFDWYDNDEKICLEKAIELYSFNQRIRYGLPIEEEKKRKLLKRLKSSKYGYKIRK